MIRTPKERVIQTLVYEIGGILLVTPMYTMHFNTGISEGFFLFIIMSLLVLVWTGIHNTLFDCMEWRFAERIASDRNLGYRLLHVLSLELTSTIFCLPLILLVTDLSLIEALVLDIVLTLVYGIYGLVFHWLYDYVRPVKQGVVIG